MERYPDGYNLIVFMCCSIIRFKYGRAGVLDWKTRNEIQKEKYPGWVQATLQSPGWVHDRQESRVSGS